MHSNAAHGLLQALRLDLLEHPRPPDRIRDREEDRAGDAAGDGEGDWPPLQGDSQHGDRFRNTFHARVLRAALLPEGDLHGGGEGDRGQKGVDQKQDGRAEEEDREGAGKGCGGR